MSTKPNYRDNRYPKISMWWGVNARNDLTMYDVTIDEILTRASQFGYKRPTWYTPWRWLVPAGYVAVGFSY